MSAEDKPSRIKLLLLDVDGVMTDGHVIFTEEGEEAKVFHIKDGLGLKLLMENGVEVVLITGRSSPVLKRRAAELGIREVHEGVMDKGNLTRRLITRRGLARDEAASMGDDLQDLPMFSETGLCIAVADAAAELRDRADFVTHLPGGHGAVREVCEWLLKSQGKWARAVASFQGE